MVYHLLSELVLILCYQSLRGSMSHFFFLNISFSKHLVFTDEVFVTASSAFPPWQYFRPLIHLRTRSMLHTTMIMIFSDDFEP